MKIFRKKLLPTLVIGSVACLSACGSGSSGSDNKKPTPKTTEFTATTQPQYNNKSGQVGYVFFDISEEQNQLQISNQNSKQSINLNILKQRCKELKDAFNKTYNKNSLYKGITDIYVNDLSSKSDKSIRTINDEKAILDARVEIKDNKVSKNRCVLQLGDGLVLRSKNYTDKAPEIIITKRKDGKIEMQNGTISLAGDFSKDGANITLQLLSNPTKMFVNNYTPDGEYFKYDNSKSGVITNYTSGFSGVKLQKNLSAQKTISFKGSGFYDHDEKKIDISKINTDGVKESFQTLDSQGGNYTSFGLVDPIGTTPLFIDLRPKSPVFYYDLSFTVSNLEYNQHNADLQNVYFGITEPGYEVYLYSYGKNS